MPSIYALDYPVTDDTVNMNMCLAGQPGAGLPAITIPKNTRATLVIKPSTRIKQAIDNGADPATIGLRIWADLPNAFGTPIIETKPIAATYTYQQLAKGFTRSTTGSGIEGAAVALCDFADILRYQNGQFQLIDLPGQLIVSDSIKGKNGYRRGRFTS